MGALPAYLLWTLTLTLTPTLTLILTLTVVRRYTAAYHAVRAPCLPKVGGRGLAAPAGQVEPLGARASGARQIRISSRPPSLSLTWGAADSNLQPSTAFHNLPQPSTTFHSLPQPSTAFYRLPALDPPPLLRSDSPSTHGHSPYISRPDIPSTRGHSPLIPRPDSRRLSATIPLPPHPLHSWSLSLDHGPTSLVVVKPFPQQPFHPWPFSLDHWANFTYITPSTQQLLLRIR